MRFAHPEDRLRRTTHDLATVEEVVGGLPSQTMTIFFVKVFRERPGERRALASFAPSRETLLLRLRQFVLFLFSAISAIFGAVDR
jgi:hypothetical protein